jgi:PIN domain nuclease of toxin-antitoxin system
MRLLLDSHTLVWWLAEDSKLAPTATKAIDSSSNEVMVSAASVWEIEIKRTIGKLPLRGDVALHIQAAGFTPLAMTYRHAHAAGRLPRHHRDPFDRMLVAQAQLEDAALVTSDEELLQYDVPILSARR